MKKSTLQVARAAYQPKLPRTRPFLFANNYIIVTRFHNQLFNNILPFNKEKHIYSPLNKCRGCVFKQMEMGWVS